MELLKYTSSWTILVNHYQVIKSVLKEIAIRSKPPEIPKKEIGNASSPPPLDRFVWLSQR